MINLANKCVLIRTHEEYENILKAAKRQGYRWYGGWRYHTETINGEATNEEVKKM